MEACGHKLYTYIFSSPYLLADLWGKKINSWRTARTNKGMPLDLWYKNPKLKCGDTWAKTRGDLKSVVLLFLFTVYDLWSVTPNIWCWMVAWLASNQLEMMWRKQWQHNLKHRLRLDGLWKVKNFNQNSQYKGQDMNLSAPKCEGGLTNHDVWLDTAE
jgi:hypothetical protein